MELLCGICGFIQIDGEMEFDSSVILDMVSSLRHRGPDAQNVHMGRNFSFGFTRLSFFDIQDGMQPITNEDNSIVLICNGEIFNSEEIRKELQLKHHTFRTKTDIEVIVHLYEEYGLSLFDRLNGQFAFTLYDCNKGIFVCARDHFGIAPFFYTIQNGTFIFGSEIKSILRHPLVKRQVDLVGLDQVFNFPGLISPRTMFKNIYSLQNGHYLVIEPGSIKDVEYWDLIYPEDGDLSYEFSESHYIDTISELLTNSIKRRLRGEYPAGLYLSGGLDSSIIAGIVNKVSPLSGRHSFSIDFADTDISEGRYQRLMSDFIKSQHHRRLMTPEDTIRLLPKVIFHAEAPVKESYNSASYALSSDVKSSGLRLVLTGEGADELFAGYVGYKFDQMRRYRGSLPEDDENLTGNIWGDRGVFYERDFLSLGKIKRELYSDDLNSVFSEFDSLNHFVVNPERIRNRHVVHQRSYLDFKLRLTDHLVSDHGDRMAYANGVEARYPFLDRELVEFMMQVPPDLKIRNFVEKYALKVAARQFVPSEIINREKFAFVAQASPTLLKTNNEYLRDILSYDTIKRQGYFNPVTIERLYKQYTSDEFKLNIPFDMDLLIIVITFGIFLNEFSLA